MGPRRVEGKGMERLLQYHINGFGPHSRVVRTCWRVAYTLAPRLADRPIEEVVHQACDLVDRWIRRTEDPDYFRFTIVELMLEELKLNTRSKDESID